MSYQPIKCTSSEKEQYHSVHFQVIYLKICTQTFRCVASGSAKREALVIGDVTLQFDDSIVIEILKSHDRCES